MSDLCEDSTLDANIRLMDDTITKILTDDPWDDDEKLDYVRALHRLSMQFRTIQESKAEGGNHGAQ